MRKYLLPILLIGFWSCEEKTEPEDCAGISGGENICGCTDETAINYDSTATFDNQSCEYDTLPPTISFLSHQSNDKVKGEFVIEAEILDNTTTKKVDWYVDDLLVESDSLQPYELSLSSRDFNNGYINIKIIALDNFENSAVSEPLILQIYNWNTFVYNMCDSTEENNNRLTGIDGLELNNGNYFIAGNNIINNDNIYFSIIDSVGNHINTFNTTEDRFLKRLIKTSDNHIFMLSNNKFKLVDSGGAIIWEHILENNAYATAAIETTNGDYIILNDNGNNGFLQLTKFDASGNYVSNLQFYNGIDNSGGAVRSGAGDLVEDDNGDIIICGTTNDDRIFITKLNGWTNLYHWDRLIDNGYDNSPHSLNLLDNGDLVFGTSSDNVFRLNSEGDIIWEKTLSLYSVFITDIKIRDGGNISIVGFADNALYSNARTGFHTLMDTDGSVIENTFYDIYTYQTTLFHSLSRTQDGGLLFVGTYESDECKK